MIDNSRAVIPYSRDDAVIVDVSNGMVNVSSTGLLREICSSYDRPADQGLTARVGRTFIKIAP